MNRAEAWKIVTEFVKAEGLRGYMSGQWVRTLARESLSHTAGCSPSALVAWGWVFSDSILSPTNLKYTRWAAA